MKKVILMLVTSFLSLNAFAIDLDPSRLTEPVLMYPFAKKIKTPEVCKQAIADTIQGTAIALAASDLRSTRTVALQSYEITARGVLDAGSIYVFEAIEIMDLGYQTNQVKIRADFSEEAGDCKVQKIRVMSSKRL